MRKILIADDAELNREILCDIFCEQFVMLEAENGQEAIDIIQRENDELALIMLDLMMPIRTGMDVLNYMKEQELIDKIPVIMITGESTTSSEVQAYEYGVADIIHKPFSRRVVIRRSLNIIELYENRKSIENQLEERTTELKFAMKKLSEAHEKMAKANDFLVSALSSVLEFRSLESGQHIRRVQLLTGILLQAWKDLHVECTFTKGDIEQMVAAAALHDIGKIAIPDEILCKPGKLTKEEYETMKTHTVKGCELLEHFKQEDSEFYRYCHDICRYHHERYDGGGYPDRLSGDEIPIWAQVVSIVDVYDALVSPRVYKAPYSIEEAFRMIHDGECGMFSPQILECFEATKFEIIKATEAQKLEVGY